MPPSGEDNDRATSEAAYWLFALEDAPDDDALRARFEAWLAASPAHAAAWAEVAQIYGLMAQTTPRHAARWADRDGGGAPGAASKPAPQRWRRVLACVSVVLLIALTFEVRTPADYVTSTAQRRTVLLPDGSIARLGPDTAIDVAFSPDHREIRLRRGAVFLEVRHDSKAPFRVVAQGLEATDLGTAFEVRAIGDAVVFAVREGEIRVAGARATAEQLGPGQWLRVDRTGHAERGVADRDEIAPWLEGQIVVRDQSIADVVDQFRPYFGGRIVLTDQALGAAHVTGVYNTADPIAALRAIAGAHGGAVYRLSPWLLLVTAE